VTPGQQDCGRRQTLELEAESTVILNDDRLTEGGSVQLVVGGAVEALHEVGGVDRHARRVVDRGLVAADVSRDVYPAGGQKVPPDADIARPELKP
jgi:hypothetical protein